MSGKYDRLVLIFDRLRSGGLHVRSKSFILSEKSGVGIGVKIKIEEDRSMQEMEITIRCRQTNESVIRILEMLRMTDKKLTGYRDEQTYILDVSQILYIDTVEKRTFLYTDREVYETPLRLYELEDRLESCDFFRASKSSIVNFNQIQSLKPEFGGTMQVTMTNGERLNVSRQYAKQIKEKLGCL